jgi:hypothetical protein
MYKVASCDEVGLRDLLLSVLWSNIFSLSSGSTEPKIQIAAAAPAHALPPDSLRYLESYLFLTFVTGLKL